MTHLFQVFLQHLSPLLSLSTFTALWLTILEFMDKYMHADKSDLLVSDLLLQYLSQESNTSDFLYMYMYICMYKFRINSMYWVFEHFFHIEVGSNTRVLEEHAFGNGHGQYIPHIRGGRVTALETHVGQNRHFFTALEKRAFQTEKLR